MNKRHVKQIKPVDSVQVHSAMVNGKTSTYSPSSVLFERLQGQLASRFHIRIRFFNPTQFASRHFRISVPMGHGGAQLLARRQFFTLTNR